MKKHQRVDSLGFDVPVEQLAHDLAIAKLSNDKTLQHDGDGYSTDSDANDPWTRLDEEYFAKYKQWYDQYSKLLDDRTRYDSAFKSTDES